MLLRKLHVGFLTLRGRKVGRPGQEDSTSVNGKSRVDAIRSSACVETTTESYGDKEREER